MIVVVASYHFNVSMTPDRVVILLGIAALATNRVRLFLKDWSLFLVVLLAWQVLTGMSRHFGNFRPHVGEMIAVDRWLFGGHVPTVWLQAHLYHPGQAHWYDIMASTFYLAHFMFPLIVAFALWLWNRAVYLEFMVAFLVLALAGFATNVFFPAAPPWIAADWWHRLPHVYRILHVGIAFFGNHASYSGLYKWMWSHGGWDLFGAVPSEHAAFPFLCFLYGVVAWRRIGWLLLLYCAGVWFSVVYLGEHYVADVLAGILYATLVFALVHFVMRRITWTRPVPPAPVREPADVAPV